ncbi:MAG: hypothetical protein V7459_13585 [Oceanicoccus sp.]
MSERSVHSVGAGLAVREMRKLVNEPHIDAVSDALDRENWALQALFVSNDFAEGFTACVERRPPTFKGA